MPYSDMSPRDPSATAPRRLPLRSAADLAPAERAEQPADWRLEAERLRTALQEVVELAGTGGEARQQVVQMQRRAAAALTGLDISPRR